MSNFSEDKIERADDGKFAPKATAETDIELEAHLDDIAEREEPPFRAGDRAPNGNVVTKVNRLDRGMYSVLTGRQRESQPSSAAFVLSGPRQQDMEEMGRGRYGGWYEGGDRALVEATFPVEAGLEHDTQKEAERQADRRWQDASSYAHRLGMIGGSAYHFTAPQYGHRSPAGQLHYVEQVNNEAYVGHGEHGAALKVSPRLARQFGWTTNEGWIYDEGADPDDYRDMVEKLR